MLAPIISAALLTAALSGTADVQRSFVVRARLADVTAWATANRAAIQETMGCSVIAHDTTAGTIELLCRTPRGTFDLVVRETQARSRSLGGVEVATYSTDLVWCPSHNVNAQSIRATFWQVSGGTAINIRVQADIPSITRIGLTRGFRDALDRFVAMVRSRWR